MPHSWFFCCIRGILPEAGITKKDRMLDYFPAIIVLFILGIRFWRTPYSGEDIGWNLIWGEGEGGGGKGHPLMADGWMLCYISCYVYTSDLSSTLSSAFFRSRISSLWKSIEFRTAFRKTLNTMNASKPVPKATAPGQSLGLLHLVLKSIYSRKTRLLSLLWLGH